MKYFQCFIKGVPYAHKKFRGRKDAAIAWSEQVKSQTKELPVIKQACAMKVTFLLPPDKFPKDYPYGPDLDNLLKRFMDALNETVFKESHGKDSCVVMMTAIKAQVSSEDKAGAHVEFIPISMT